jgi:Ca-activated chloride channel family protein
LCATIGLRAEEPETTITVDVKLVNVFVTVTDGRGAPVANLQKENFLLKEDGKEQKIAIFGRESALPLSIVLAVDTSLSTRKDLPLELTSARKFAHAIVRPQDGLAVYKFSEEVSQMVPFTSDLKKIDAGIDRVHNFSGIAGAGPAAGKKSHGGDHRWRRHHEPGGLQRGIARGPGVGGDHL